MTDHSKIAIIGAGPAGLSAAAHAAALGLSHILIERAPHLSNTVFRYQKGKHVMAEPTVLPLRSDLSFTAGSREAVLETWEQGAQALGIQLQHNGEVTAIQRTDNGFSIQLHDGTEHHAEQVILAIGMQGNLRKLGVPGDDLACVQYQLDDPDEYHDETIVVVGAGDAAIENALALAANNQVILINRKDEFARAKEGNRTAILKAIEQQKISCLYNSQIVAINTPTYSSASTANASPPPATSAQTCTVQIQTAEGIVEIVAQRVIARLGAVPPRRFIESCGVRFPNEDPAAVPVISSHYESNVPGLYIIGALAGYPLIKQAMNQGYEVVEFIQGNAIKPADEPLLEDKLRAVSNGVSVEQTLQHFQQQVPLLAELSPLQLRELMLDSQVHAPSPGEVIFHHNDYTNTFFCIIDGTVSVAIDPDNPDHQVQLRRGEFFGEMSLISGRRRSATVAAGEHCVLLEIPRLVMNKLISSVAAVKQIIDQTFILRAIQSRLAPQLSHRELAPIVASAQLRQYAAGEVLFHEGDPADSLHLIRKGSVTVSRQQGERDIVLSYVPAGNYVGEMALVGNAPRSATVRAAIASETIVLPGDQFKQLLEHNADLRHRVMTEYQRRTNANLEALNRPAGGDIISFLMQQGVGEATDVLLIDESLCIRCDNCEKACAETHGGTSRLDREAGPTYAMVHLPTSCRHCEHPHCMKDCPPDAIHRAPDGEVFIADNCIGCGNCETNCPYGVIRMASLTEPKPGLWSWLLFGIGHGPGENKQASARAGQAANHHSQNDKKAVKCDMCKDLPGGAACVRACPTGAALRISPERLADYVRATDQGD